MKNLFKILFAAAFMSTIMISCDNDDQILNNDSFANFNFEQNFLTVDFTSVTSENATSYDWNFGDGQTSDAENPTITYENFGSYTVTLSINDEDATVQRTVTVAPPSEDASSFAQISSLPIGGEGAAEIAAHDAINQQLFVVNNDGGSTIDVIDFSNPNTMSVTSSIDVSAYGGGVNSVAVSKQYLAAAIEANVATDNGVIVVWKADSLAGPVAVVTAGALPDMVTFSPDGSYILSANEGEPQDDYSVDPEGSVTIVETENFSSLTLGFSGFNNMVDSLAKDAFRVFGPGATLAQDVEPEYITVSPDGSTAYVALQENNGLAVIDLAAKRISGLLPLGLKDYSKEGNEIDPSDDDAGVNFRSVPVFGMYQPDAIAAYEVDGTTYVISANEGDARDYGGFSEEVRVSDLPLDATAFPDAATLKENENLGRLLVTNVNGDINGDGIYEALWSFGARSFSIWNGGTGKLEWDSGNELEEEANKAGLYPDGRSDAKGVEPEGVVVGSVSGSPVAFIGLERADAVAIYDVSEPKEPKFLSILETGDAPEGLVFINPAQSPTRKSLLVVASEGDGTIRVYETAN
ncbi:PKD domain-containing protein [Fulvivirga sp. M361]|uniref:choice-of-anchor I family protein n=1 Tax=Fulvivirga sp. M361 TaxID=2594266 RepID=UPI00117AA8D0|nr:choice-of-anchor I family protein [Fulvivirga sp. M361]TRX50418.1 PKD domain-containing protein [Fulvivirga sp. M361]